MLTVVVARLSAFMQTTKTVLKTSVSIERIRRYSSIKKCIKPFQIQRVAS